MRSQTPFESVIESAIFLTSSYWDSMILPSSSHLVAVSTELAMAFFSANVSEETLEPSLDARRGASDFGNGLFDKLRDNASFHIINHIIGTVTNLEFHRHIGVVSEG